MEKDQAIDRCRAALEAGDSGVAAGVVCQFERSRGRPRGIGMDWNALGTERALAAEVASILRLTPRDVPIVKGAQDNRFPELRVAAALSSLWGEDTSRFLPGRGKEALPGNSFDIATAARMLLFQVKSRQAFADLQGEEVEFVKLLCTETSDEWRSCEYCRALAGKIYRLAEAPIPPHAGCNHKMGCRCEMLPDF